MIFENNDIGSTVETENGSVDNRYVIVTMCRSLHTVCKEIENIYSSDHSNFGFYRQINPGGVGVRVGIGV